MRTIACAALVSMMALSAGCGDSTGKRLDTGAMENDIRGSLAKQVSEEAGTDVRVSSIDCIASSDSDGTCIAGLRAGLETTRVRITVSVDSSTGEYIWSVDE